MKGDIPYLAKGYFQSDEVEKEWLQHTVYEECNKMRFLMLHEHEMEISQRELYLDQLAFYQDKEHYGMCQLLIDSANRYEIDIEI